MESSVPYLGNVYRQKTSGTTPWKLKASSCHCLSIRKGRWEKTMKLKQRFPRVKPLNTESRLNLVLIDKKKRRLGKKQANRYQETWREVWPMFVDRRRRENSRKSESKLWPMLIERRGRGKKPKKPKANNSDLAKSLTEYKINGQEWSDHSKLWLHWERLESYRERSRWLDNKEYFFPLQVNCDTLSRIWEVLDQKATVNRDNIRRLLLAF